MSEYINNSELRINNLYTFAVGIIGHENGAHLVKEYIADIENVHPFDVISIVDRLMIEKFELNELKSGINKVLNMFYKNLVNQPIPDYSMIPFLSSLWFENKELESRLISLKPIIRELNSKEIPKTKFQSVLKEIGTRVTELQAFDLHYIKKENILFPYAEKQLPEYRCQSVMWSFHDDIRKYIKDIVSLSKDDNPNMKLINRHIGDLFFAMNAIKFREEYILFPVIEKLMTNEDWISMQLQSYEIGFAFIDPPEVPDKISKQNQNSDKRILSIDELAGGLIDLDTGQLSIDQITMMMNNLPVDITFVDENDEVRYFSTPKHRIFPRSKAIIGRLVENCHPPSSVHIVQELIDAFKSGKKSSESFWIEMGDQFILIRYFALRDSEGNYKGTIEVSEEVSSIRKLKGEKRLME